MAAYFIAEIDVTDPTTYEQYRRLVEPTLVQYGGTYLARGGATTLFEGEPAPKRMVVVEFESVEQARAWYDSEEYAPAKAVRQASSTGRLLVIEGV
jgi:uncharacterized protein (DUF1330 family)